MRRANTTFVNLRSHARRRRPARERVEAGGEAAAARSSSQAPALAARRRADGARPQHRSIRKPGADNDLIDLTCTPSRRWPRSPRPRSSATTRPAAAASTSARRAAPSRRPSRRSRSGAGEIGFAPPVHARLPRLVRRLLDHRRATTRSAASRARGIVQRRRLAGERRPGDHHRARALRGASVQPKQYRRCPGSAEAPATDGSNVLSDAEREALGCEESRPAAGTRGEARARGHSHVWSACAPAPFVLTGASDQSAQRHARRYKIKFDNAFGLTRAATFRSAACTPARRPTSRS